MAVVVDRYIGIDVSKDTLDVSVQWMGKPRERWQCANDSDGIAACVARCMSLKPKLIVLEATGGYQDLVTADLASAGLSVVVANPRLTRRHAESHGRLAKTDRVDADDLARYAEENHPEVRPLPDAQSRAFSALLTRRRQLVDMRTAEMNRRHHAQGEVKKGLLKHIKWLDSEVKRLDDELHDIIRNSPVWREKDDLLRSVKGVATVTSTTMLALLPELGTLNRAKIGVLVGVAPMNRDSGKRKGTRRCWGGRGTVRAVLYMATMAATRFNPIIRAFYQAKLAEGKLPKVALVAAAHKLLTILNAILKTGKPWEDRLKTA